MSLLHKTSAINKIRAYYHCIGLGILEEKFMSRKTLLSHPGEILLEDWLNPMGVSQYALAKAIEVPPKRINEIVHGKRGITADTAVRLAAFFGTDAQSWMNLQTHYDIELARASMQPLLSRIILFDNI